MPLTSIVPGSGDSPESDRLRQGYGGQAAYSFSFGEDSGATECRLTMQADVLGLSPSLDAATHHHAIQDQQDDGAQDRHDPFGTPTLTSEPHRLS